MEETTVVEQSNTTSPMVVDNENQQPAEETKELVLKRSKSRSRSRTRSASRDRSRSHSPRRSRKADRKNRRKDSRDRSYSRSRSRSRSPERRRRRRSISHSRSPSSRRRSRSYDRRRSPSQRGTRDNPYPTEVLGLFGLSLRTKESDLETLLSKYGRLEKVTVVYDHRNSRSRGFGFATFVNIDEATKARDDLNGTTLQGRKIRVDYSLTQRPHDPTPGQYMGDKTRDRYRIGSSYRGTRRNSPRRSPYRRRSRSRSRSRERRRSRRDRSRSRSRTRSRSWSRSRR